MLFFCNQCRVNLEAYITVDHIWLWMCSPDVPIMTWSNQIYTRWLWPPSILGPWGQTEVSQDQPWPQTTATMWWSPASWMVSFFFEGHFHQERRTICWMFLEKQDQFERFVAMLQVSFDTELSPCSLAFHLPRHQGLRHPLSRLAWPSHPRPQQRRWGGEKIKTSYELTVFEGDGGRGLCLLVFSQWTPWLLPLHIACQVAYFWEIFKHPADFLFFQGSNLQRLPVLLPHTNPGLFF